jgi:hypothetical protein
MLSGLLRNLSPQVSIRTHLGMSEAPPNYEPTRYKVEPMTKPAEIPLVTLCALELFNHMVEGAEYRICANERCQRRFVNQQGRAEKGQHRSRGVMCCSLACARATAQRMYRLRRKSAAD